MKPKSINAQLTKKDFYSLATERKLEEAYALLGLTEQVLDSNIFLSETFFNAFLNSIRFIPKHLDAELKRLTREGLISKGTEWYNEQMKKIGELKISKLFIELRNESAKSSVIESIPKLEPLKGKYTNTDFTIDWRNKRLKKFEKEFKDKGLLSLSREYYNIMKKLVEEASEKFGFDDIPLRAFNGNSGYMKPATKAQINRTIKDTYNQLLKNPINSA